MEPRNHKHSIEEQAEFNDVDAIENGLERTSRQELSNLTQGLAYLPLFFISNSFPCSLMMVANMNPIAIIIALRGSVARKREN